MTEKQRERIEPDLESRRLSVPHLGITLRSLFGAAANAQGDSKNPHWTLRYKGVDIGQIRLKIFKQARESPAESVDFSA